MLECVPVEESALPLLRLARLERGDALAKLDKQQASCFRGVDLSMLDDDVDSELVAGLLGFCASVAPGGATLNIAHTDLGTGTDCEQRLFELTAERRLREKEKVFAEKVKRDSAKEKDFANAAAKRRKGQEGIDVAVERLAVIETELIELERRKLEAPWYKLFSHIQETNCNPIRHLDLSNCGLHATGLGFLTQIMLELENRFEGEKISWLTLDGNDLTDIAMGVLASFLRLSRVIEGLQVRNVGITEQGVSELTAGLVTNRSLRLLDVRSNGLCNADAAKCAVTGVQRFNSAVKILLT